MVILRTFLHNAVASAEKSLEQLIMALSQSSHSNDVTDISHVLENLGSLIGELNSLEVNKVIMLECVAWQFCLWG